MFNVTYESSRALVHVTFAGHVDAREAMECEKQVQELLPGIEPGFSVLTDLGSLEQMDHACSKRIQSTMDLFRQAGVQRIIRVSLDPRKDIGFNIMSIIHYRSKVEIHTVDTLEEALDLIEDSRKDEPVYEQ